MTVAIVWALCVALALPAWAATWTVMRLASTPHAVIFSGISCQSATRCYAVGTISSPGGDQAVIEHWDGSHWTFAAAPTGVFGDLYGVSCDSSGCVAVGASGGVPERTLIERWSGSGWHIVKSPNAGTRGSGLYGVSCTSASSCMAVGYSWASASARHSLAEKWNGTSWSIVATPNPAADSYLNKVSCVSASMCLAVGNMAPPNKGYAAKWNGSAWSYSPIYSPAFTTDVTCTSSTSCLAAAYEFPATYAVPVVQQWNGNGWVDKKLPNPTETSNALYAISCRNTKDCIAVGIRQVKNDPYHDAPLIEHWDGTTWHLLSIPNVSKINYLQGADCRSACIAVGFVWDGVSTHPQHGLAESRG